MKNYLYPGDKIETASSLFIVSTRFDGLFVTCREYSKFDDDDLFFVGLRWLTLFDIASLLKDADGLDHKVIWYEERE